MRVLSALALAASTVVLAGSMVQAAGILNDNLYLKGATSGDQGTKGQIVSPWGENYIGSGFGFIAVSASTQITKLGYFDPEGNGITGDHVLSVWHTKTWNQQNNPDDPAATIPNTTTLLTQINTNGLAGGTQSGLFRYYDLQTPVALTPGDAYFVTGVSHGNSTDKMWFSWYDPNGSPESSSNFRGVGDTPLFNSAVEPHKTATDSLRWRNGTDVVASAPWNSAWDFSLKSMGNNSSSTDLTTLPAGGWANNQEFLVNANAWVESVPEPTSLGLIVLGGVALLRRRSR